jgi:hypothetical protein
MRSLLTLLRVSRAAVFTRGGSGGARGMVVVALCAVVGALGLTAGSASAIETHVFSTSFGSAGSGAGQLITPEGVAANTVTHDVYVADTGNFRIDEFTSSGAFLRAWGWGVADGLPAFETCTLICQAGISGSGAGQFATPAFIAVDNSGGASAGDVYVGDPGDNLVSKFDALGNLISSWGSGGQLDGSTAADGPFGEVAAKIALTGITVGGNGTLYALNNLNRVFEFGQDGSFSTDFRLQGSQSETGLAIDSAGDIFNMGGDGGVEKYTSAGEEIGVVDNTKNGKRFKGLAIDPSTGELYLILIGTPSEVRHYAFAGPEEVVETGGVACRIVPRSGLPACPPTDSFGSEALVSINPGNPLTEAAAGVGFDSGRVYVTDAIEHRVNVFTPATLADTTTEPPAPVGKTTATLHGTVNPDGIEVTSCEFEWGTKDEVYPNKIPCSSAPGSGGVPVEVSAELTGLTAQTEYFYRLAVGNAQGVNHGKSESLTTLAAVDTLSTGPAESVTATGAKLTGSLSPDGADTHYYFEYGTSNSYGSTSPTPPGTDAGNASESVHAKTTLSGLAANSVYHYRLVGVNSFGTTVGEDAVFTTPGPPSIVSDSAEVKPTEQVGQTGATLQAQINPDGRETTYQFEYGETISYGTSVPVPAGELGSGEEPVAAPAAELSGLKLGTTYHFRIVASNEYGTVASVDQTFTTLSAVVVDSESASSVTAVSATLNAQVNPLGRETSAYFRYGPLNCEPTACTDVPLPPGTNLGAPESDQTLNIHLQGLASGTTYEYRVIAANAAGTVEAPSRTFTTQAAGSEFTQSDGRAWELVSPPNKQGAGIIAVGNEQGSDIQAAASGGGITYTATAPFVANPAGNRAIETAQIISRRQTPAVWETADITTADNDGPAALLVGQEAEYKLFSSDLSAGFVEPADKTPLQPGAEGSKVYIRRADGTYEGLTAGNVPAGANFSGKFVSAAPDGSHVVLSSETKLTSTATPLGALYEWSAGQIQLASVLPNGESTSALLGEHEYVVRHAISDDGSRLVWHAPGLEAAHLYMRDMVRGETVQLDAAEGAPEPVGLEVQSHYRTANREGSRVFFTSHNRLTADSTAHGGAEDLYVFELTSGHGEPLAGKLNDLTVDPNGGESADVKGVIGASEDGSYVAFIAAGVLGDAAARGAKPGFNLYVEHYDAGTRTWDTPTFVAALSGGDRPDWDEAGGGGFGGMTSRVSPNGRYLAFMSEKSLTGYENRDANSGVPDEEVFLYDTNAGRLTCVSCDPTGARPVGLREGQSYEENLVDYAKNWENRWIAGNIPGWTTTDLLHSLYQSRYLSDSGRLFFDSSDALVPADVNGKEDVYEYEPDGVGGCRGAGHGQSASIVFDENIGGCVALVSAGASTEESAFMDASESGGDVFFLTLSRLSPQDYDNSVDLYDAHECTPSSPCAPQPPLSPPPCVTGDACKPAPTPQPALFGTPSSATFSGAGNIGPPTSKPGVTPRRSTQAKKLAKALRTCAVKPKRKRAACERRARKKFGAKGSRITTSLSARTGR